MLYSLIKKLLVSCLIAYCFMKLDFVAMSIDSNYQDLTFTSAQCHAMCLNNYMKVKSIRTECVESCKNRPDICENHCKKDNIGCLEGCKYLKNIINIHPGQCPQTASSNDNKGRQLSCLSKCKSDRDCHNTLYKCCSLGCNHVCAETTFNNSVPKIAPLLKPAAIPNSSDIEFEWMTHYKDFVSDNMPLTFVLQTRVCPCKFFNPSYVGKWQTLIITSQSGARLNAFDQGKVYQFRLAAVSPYGTRGYGPVSQPVPEKVDRPDNPASPRGLTELLSRLYSTGKISVTIGWEKPEEHVLPISEYVIKWMIDYGYVQSDGHAISALTQFTQSLPSHRISYVLENLKPNTSYRVEVFAKIYWPGDEPLLSEPVILFLATPAINFSINNGVYQEDRQGYCKNRTLRHNTKLFSVEISNSFYVSGQVQINIKIIYSSPATYRVSWTPKICIDSPDNHLSENQQKTQFLQTTNKFVEIKGVMFNCRYHLSISIVDNKAGHFNVFSNPLNSVSIEGHFCVPSCSEVLANSNVQALQCFDYKTKLPPQPQRLSSVILNRNMKTYKLSWMHPELLTNSQDDSSKSKYRIIWGPRFQEPVNENLYGDITGLFPIIDSAKSNVKVVNKEITSLILENLLPQTMYIVKAQLLLTLKDGQEMESDVSTHYFNTGLDIGLTGDYKSSADFLYTKRLVWIVYISLTFAFVFENTLLSEFV